MIEICKLEQNYTVKIRFIHIFLIAIISLSYTTAFAQKKSKKKSDTENTAIPKKDDVQCVPDSLIVKKNSKITYLNLGMNNFDQVIVRQIHNLCKRNLERSQKAIVPNHVKQIVALNLKASRFNDVYKQIEEKEATRRE
jgi:hypothetical protein